MNFTYKGLISLFKFLFIHSGRTIFWSILIGLVSGISSAGVIFLINSILKKITLTDLVIIAIFFMVSLISIISKVISQILLINIFQKGSQKLRSRIVNNILSSPLRKIEDIGSAKIMSALTDDILVVSNVAVGIPILCVNLAIVICCSIYIGMLSWIILLTQFAFIFAGVIGYQIFSIKAHQSLARARSEQNILFKHLRSIIEGVKELKLNSYRKYLFLKDSLIPTMENYREQSAEGMTYFSTVANIGQILFFIFIGILIFIFPVFLLIEKEILVSAILVILYMKGPLDWMLSWLPFIGRANVALQNIESLGLLEIEDDDKNISSDLNTEKESIKQLEARNIIYRYYDEDDKCNFQLGPINLSFFAGEISFIIGGNGSGKSTLAKILTGLYSPEDGEILLNGNAIQNINREKIRQNFSAIFFDFYLFENLPIEPDLVLDEKAKDFLVQLQLDKKVRIEKGKLSSVTALSQGQRKRLALLNSFIEDRPIFLFDEWAADQEPNFRNIFYSQILPELKKKGKMVIVISHDDRYFHLADKLIKLDYGQIVPFQPFERAIGQILINNNIITSQQLENAIIEQNKSPIKERIGEVLIRLGYAKPKDIRDNLVGQLGIGQVLVDLKIITSAQLHEALLEQNKSAPKLKLGEILIKMGYVTEQQIQEALKQ